MPSGAASGEERATIIGLCPEVVSGTLDAIRGWGYDQHARRATGWPGPAVAV
jgi:hypothetical protein